MQQELRIKQEQFDKDKENEERTRELEFKKQAEKKTGKIRKIECLLKVLIIVIIIIIFLALYCRSPESISLIVGIIELAFIIISWLFLNFSNKTKFLISERINNLSTRIYKKIFE